MIVPGMLYTNRGERAAWLASLLACGGGDDNNSCTEGHLLLFYIYIIYEISLTTK